MRHAKARLTIYPIIDGKNGRDGRNGQDGQKGDKGDPGLPGEPGQPGKDGAKGDKGDRGVPGLPGRDGRDGAKGDKGEDGKDGLTPMPNLLRNADLPANLGAWHKNTNNRGTIAHDPSTAPPITGVQVWAATAQAASESYGELWQQVTLVKDKKYTLSAYAKGATNGFLIGYPIGEHTALASLKPLADDNLKEGWKRYAVTFTAKESGVTNIYLRAWYQSAYRQSGKVFFAAPKLEEGSVATPWARASADFKGDDGVGVSSVVTEYAVSSSETSAPSSGWSTTLPTWRQGQYLWTRSRVTFTDGRVTTTQPQYDPTWKKLSDLAYEQAHMAYLKQVFEQRAGIDGGLLFGAMLQMRDAPKNGASVGDVAAYFNGLRSVKVGNAPRPALALGVNNFGKGDETEAVALNFDGSGHIGDLEFSGSGSLVTRGDDGQVLTEFTRQSRCDVSELIKKSEHRISLSGIDLRVTRRGYERYNSGFKVTAPYGRGQIDYTIVVVGSPQYDEAVARGDRPPLPSRVWAEAILERKVGYNDYVPHLVIGSGATLSGREDIRRTIELFNLPVGEYRITFQADSEYMDNASASFYSNSGYYTEGLIKPFNAIAGDGIMSFHSSEQYTFIKDGKLTIKGDMGFPSVVACGRVKIGGELEYQWGKVSRVWRRSTGEYLIYHTLGHTNYCIVITPLGNGNLMQGQLAAQTGDVAWCYIKDVQNGCRMVNTPFSFAILAW